MNVRAEGAGYLVFTCRVGHAFSSIVQHPFEAVHDSMPLSAIKRDDVDAILTMDELAARLPALVEGGSLEPEPDAFSRPA